MYVCVCGYMTPKHHCLAGIYMWRQRHVTLEASLCNRTQEFQRVALKPMCSDKRSKMLSETSGLSVCTAWAFPLEPVPQQAFLNLSMWMWYGRPISRCEELQEAKRLQPYAPGEQPLWEEMIIWGSI